MYWYMQWFYVFILETCLFKLKLFILVVSPKQKKSPPKVNDVSSTSRAIDFQKLLEGNFSNLKKKITIPSYFRNNHRK